MRLFNLRLENFQGKQSFEADFGGMDAEIRADNALGKTTIGNAVTWLLTDKPLTGSKNFSPKPKDQEGKEIHNLESGVEGRFQLATGQFITFKKVLSEDWRKTRGSNTETLKGNTISYFIDGVPVKESEYTMRLTNICDIERMKMLMMPGEFAETLAWQERRHLLVDICGDVTDVQIIESTKELKELPGFLQKPGAAVGELYTVEEFGKIASAKMKDINDELKAIPERIDEAKRAAPEITPDDKAILAIDFGSLQTSKYLKENEKSKLQSGSSVNDVVRDEVAAAESELSKARIKYRQDADKANEAVQEAISQFKNKCSDLKSKQQDLIFKANDTDRKAKGMGDLREMLLRSASSIQERYTDIAAEQWNGETVCPRCKQSLPPEQVVHAKEEFNQHKSERLESARGDMERINARGKTECSKQMVADEEAAAKKYRDEAAELGKQIAALEAQIDEKESLLKVAVSFEETFEYAKVSSKIAKLRAGNGKADELTAEKISAIQAEIDAINAQVNAYMSAKERSNTAAAQEKRIVELSAREKELAKQYEYFKKGVYLCETFIRTKVKMLDERINSHFKSVRFKLFEDQINGGLKETCEVLVPGETGLIPWRDANTAGCVNAGLEIIGALSEHWGLSMPVIVDGAESVQHLPPINAQVIHMTVPPTWDKLGDVAQKALTMEYGSEDAARTAFEAPNKQLTVITKKKTEAA